VGKGRKFEILEGSSVDSYLSAIEGEERRGGSGAPAAAAAAEEVSTHFWVSQDYSLSFTFLYVTSPEVDGSSPEDWKFFKLNEMVFFNIHY